MNVRWSPEAAADFGRIVEYIRQQNPSAADRVAHSLYDSVASLESFPNRGRQQDGGHSRTSFGTTSVYRGLSS